LVWIDCRPHLLQEVAVSPVGFVGVEVEVIWFIWRVFFDISIVAHRIHLADLRARSFGNSVVLWLAEDDAVGILWGIQVNLLDLPFFQNLYLNCTLTCDFTRHLNWSNNFRFAQLFKVKEVIVNANIIAELALGSWNGGMVEFDWRHHFRYDRLVINVQSLCLLWWLHSLRLYCWSYFDAL